MKHFKKLKMIDLLMTIPLSNFFSKTHPEVYIIPQELYFNVIDDFGDHVGIFQMVMPFSSFNFYADIELEGGVFNALYDEPKFHRLGGVKQLGFLCPPKPRNFPQETKYFYSMPFFPHTRWGHSLLTAILAELVLARNGFPKSERDPFVLTAGCHDIATPGGGDSVMRVDTEWLSEEINFCLVMEKDGLADRWKKEFNFIINLASDWVKNIGPWGKLLDVIDKISYISLDAYYIGNDFSENKKPHFVYFCRQHPLVMDIWQDIRFDGETVWFSNSSNLFNFLLLRAYLFSEVYLNSRCRALDWMLCKEVKKHYKREMREKLLSWTDDQLQTWLSKKGGLKETIISPDKLVWKKFSSQEEALVFANQIKKVSHVEEVKPFKTGLDWLVKNGKKRTQLQNFLANRQINQLKYLSVKNVGWYVYYSIE